jgi:hypothetical protein
VFIDFSVSSTFFPRKKQAEKTALKIAKINLTKLLKETNFNTTEQYG